MSTDIKTIEAFSVTGLKTRTTNAVEQTPAAKIGALWQQFFGSGLFNPADQSAQVVGVYANYESDWNGAFDVIAGSTQSAISLPETQSIQVQAGQYLVFRSKGAMPQAVIEGWMQVWQFFRVQRPDVKRSYQTDFEQYIGQDEVAIHIGVQGTVAL